MTVALVCMMQTAAVVRAFPSDRNGQQDVNRDFIESMRKAGLSATDADKLVAFRIHGVTPEMVTFLRSAGYQPDEDKLIAMRIHGVTPDFINGLQAPVAPREWVLLGGQEPCTKFAISYKHAD